MDGYQQRWWESRCISVSLQDSRQQETQMQKASLLECSVVPAEVVNSTCIDLAQTTEASDPAVQLLLRSS